MRWTLLLRTSQWRRHSIRNVKPSYEKLFRHPSSPDHHVGTTEP